ncbi:MAG: UDP-N-acetylglucosamine 2-epimerase [Candidatus Hermodarchaeota archaeon]
MSKKIAVLTGSRAEYGILKPLLNQLLERKDFELVLLVTGLHLLKEYGHTIANIKKDKFKIDSIVEMYDEKETDVYYGAALARGIKNLSLELSKINPDLLIVLGDRLEPLAATLAAATLNIPIAHIHGGDKTDSGLIDESIRHSITRFAHIHFPATEDHKRRLIRMGEEPWRIFKVGSMGIDTIIQRKKIPRKELSKKLHFEINDKTFILIFHPVHLEEDLGDQMREILEALKELELKTIILYPNNDPGNEKIITEIEKVRRLDNFRIFKNIEHDEYIDLLKHVAVIIGNSSSGIIEAPTLKIPVINIGSRNRNRGRTENIIYVDPKKDQIIEAINKALYDKDFRKKIKKIENPFGDGKTAERISQIIKEVRFDAKLMIKKITY